MNLQTTKKYFEDVFNSHWIQTDVHYGGQDFDAKEHVSWVNPIYKPLRSSSNGMSTSTSIDMAQLYVICWADDDTDAMELADSVVEFIDSNIDKQLFISRGHDVIDHGWDESNKVFVMLSFTFEQYSGTC